MLFLEPWFWAFATIAVVGFWVCPSAAKLGWLLLASAVFQYHFAGPAGMAPIVAIAAGVYVVALAVAGGARRGLFVAACVAVVGALAFYKYSTLLITTVGLAPLGRSPAAPLGISFFTFEFVHYLYEVHVARRPPVRHPARFALFAVFFPCLAAGPIKRFPDFVPQLRGLVNPSLEEAWGGARRVIRGLFKKVCVADLFQVVARVFELNTTYNAPLVASLAVAQGFRIYYDFAGYSDIAIGLAQMLGLRVPENFDRPYFSTSLRDFWRRWHMSLSSWIRDYVYVPLGGNRVRRTLNLLVAMTVCGLWHGAAWHFAAWGAYHGGGLAAEAAVRRWWPALFAPRPGRTLARWAVCYAYVTYGWLIFFYPLPTVWQMSRSFLP